MDKLASTEEELRKIKAGAEGMRSQQAEDAARLKSTLAEIETLKKEPMNSSERWLHCLRRRRLQIKSSSKA